MKVLYASSEAYPFAMSGGLADVAGALPKALRKRFIGCRVVMPLYSSISDELRQKMTFICSITVPVAWRRQYCGIFEAHLNFQIPAHIFPGNSDRYRLAWWCIQSKRKQFIHPLITAGIQFLSHLHRRSRFGNFTK